MWHDSLRTLSGRHDSLTCDMTHCASSQVDLSGRNSWKCTLQSFCRANPHQSERYSLSSKGFTKWRLIAAHCTAAIRLYKMTSCCSRLMLAHQLFTPRRPPRTTSFCEMSSDHNDAYSKCLIAAHFALQNDADSKWCRQNDACDQALQSSKGFTKWRLQVWSLLIWRLFKKLYKMTPGDWVSANARWSLLNSLYKMTPIQNDADWG